MFICLFLTLRGRNIFFQKINLSAILKLKLHQQASGDGCAPAMSRHETVHDMFYRMNVQHGCFSLSSDFFELEKIYIYLIKKLI